MAVTRTVTGWQTRRVTGRARVRAPELVGRGGWLNTGGKEYALADLRGKIVLLDFWTFCCINCLHVIDELRPLEEKYADVLVTVGVHSPKFVHEADHEAVAAAVERYEVHHPVLDDPDLTTWDAYAVRAWPTLAVVDPEGYVVAQLSGEGHAHGLDSLLAELVEEHEAKGTLHRGDGPVRRRPSRSPRRCGSRRRPCCCPTGNVLVADAGHHSLAELGPDGETLVRPDRHRGARPGRRARRHGAVPRAERAVPAAARGGRRRSATTSWSRTPSTTRCAACRSPTGT